MKAPTDILLILSPKQIRLGIAYRLNIPTDLPILRVCEADIRWEIFNHAALMQWRLLWRKSELLFVDDLKGERICLELAETWGNPIAVKRWISIRIHTSSHFVRTFIETGWHMGKGIAKVNETQSGRHPGGGQCPEHRLAAPDSRTSPDQRAGLVLVCCGAGGGDQQRRRRSTAQGSTVSRWVRTWFTPRVPNEWASYGPIAVDEQRQQLKGSYLPFMSRWTGGSDPHGGSKPGCLNAEGYPNWEFK